MRPELPQHFLDDLYTSLDEKFHEEIYELFLKGEREKQEYKGYYYRELWKECNHEIEGQA